MWKKKRYDIHIRLSPEDLEALEQVRSLVHIWPYKKEVNARVKRFNNFYWKIHNKCVEINRK